MTWLPMHSWHPVMVHLPLVGLVLAVAFDVVATRRRSARARDAATALWWLGLLGAAAAIATGLLAYNRVDHSELAHPEMTLHRNLALGTATALFAASLWRWRRPYSRGAALLGLIGATGLGVVGYLGGDLVYRHAIGIATVRLEEVAHERGGHAHTTPAERGTPSGAEEPHHH